VDSGFRRHLSTPRPEDELRVPATARRVLLGVAGVGCGISPAFFGYFDISVWGPIGIGLVAVAIALLVAKQAVPRGIAAVAVVALLAFGAWCLLSMGWAESGDRALTEGTRWIVQGLYLLVLVLLVADRRDGEILFGSTVLAILGIAAYDLARMLRGNGGDLFSGTRLVEPLGYINGLGGFFLLGFWPLLAVAERARRPILAGAAAGMATVLAALVVLTDSRGTAFALIASAVVVLALVPGRNRRSWAIVAVIAAVAIAWSPLTDVIRELPDPTATPPDETIRRAAEWILLIAAGVAVLWGLAVWAIASLAGRRPDQGGEQLRKLSRLSAALLATIAVVGLVGGAVAVKHPFDRASDQYTAFTDLQPVKGSSRFTSGGGNRFDYWRIAWSQFTDHPLDGIGAGNFDRTYFLERRTNEDVRQAHSIELQTLGDTGLIGALLLGTFFVVVFLGAFRWAAVTRRHPAELGVAVAAIGTLLVWLAQTSVDWLHLIPGLTGIALGAAAILLRRAPGAGMPAGQAAGDTAPADNGLRPFPPVALAAVLALALVAIIFIGRPTLAEYLRVEAGDALATDPRAAVKSAEESLSLNADSLQGYYLKSAALARLDDYPRARNALREAIAREPHNYVTWALLGDLLTRRGEIAQAMRAYARAADLNPREPALRRLATRRILVERLHRRPDSVGALFEAIS
jgi:hypothetical protein